MLKKVLIIGLIVGMSASSYAISVEQENKLLLKAIVEGSTSPEQKAITARYISMLIDRKQAEANKYRELAQMNFGGKTRYRKAKQQKYLEKAKHIETQIDHYKAFVAKYTSEMAKN